MQEIGNFRINDHPLLLGMPNNWEIPLSVYTYTTTYYGITYSIKYHDTTPRFKNTESVQSSSLRKVDEYT